jgi:hypothetical protein
LKCQGAFDGSAMTEPQVGQEPSAFIDVGFQ